MATPKYKEWTEPDGLLRITGWARDGLTDQEIAQKVGVRSDTFCKWKKAYSQLAQALKEARAPVAVEIENSFFSRCRWQDVEETDVETLETPKGVRYVKTTTRHRRVPPDTACLIYALKNMLPSRYVDKPVEKNQDAQKAHTELVSAIKKIIADD